MDRQTDKQTDGRMDGRLQDFVPYRGCCPKRVGASWGKESGFPVQKILVIRQGQVGRGGIKETSLVASFFINPEISNPPLDEE